MYGWSYRSDKFDSAVSNYGVYLKLHMRNTMQRTTKRLPKRANTRFVSDYLRKRGEVGR